MQIRLACIEDGLENIGFKIEKMPYGEVSNFSDENLISQFGKNWYKYYQYTGTKMSFTGFVHMLYSALDNLKIIADLQYQGHRWELKQNLIGHAKGHTLSAPWNFINPKFGVIYNISRNYFLFANYGKSQKEPADSQIIEADDNWDANPVIAAAEVVDNTEFGCSFINQKINKEQMENIINSAMQYSLNFDLETPYFNDVKIVSVHEILDTNNNHKIKTSKRLGFKFSHDTNNE